MKLAITLLESRGFANENPRLLEKGVCKVPPPEGINLIFKQKGKEGEIREGVGLFFGRPPWRVYSGNTNKQR